jgi:hypothetical protein
MRIITYLTAAMFFGSCVAPMALASDMFVPELSGTYVFQKVENCGGGVMVQDTGSWTFTNSNKTYSAKGYQIEGVPLAIKTISGSGSYSNTTTTITFDGSTTYYVFYGALTKGVASKIVLIALGTGPCGEQFIMSH